MQNQIAQTEPALFQLRQPVGDIPEKFDQQNRLARLVVKLEQIAHGLKLLLTARLVEQRAVNVFDRGGFQVKQGFSGLHGLAHRSEKQQPDTAFLRQRNNFQFGGNNARERAFAAGQQVKQIVRLASQPCQRVTRPALQEAVRKAAGDGERVEQNHVFELGALMRQGVVAGADLHHFAVGEDDFEFVHVHARRAIDRRIGAGRIVGNHAAQRGTRTRGHVRPETKSERTQEFI